MSVEEDIQALKDSLETLRLENANLKTRVNELEDFAQTHIGMDWGSSGLDINSPHPNQSIEGAEYGGGVMRLNRFGQQILMPTGAHERASYYFVKRFWNSDDQAGHYSGDPSIEWQGLYSDSADYTSSTITAYNQRDAILSGPFAYIGFYAKGSGNVDPSAEVVIGANYDGDVDAAELRIKEDSSGNFTYTIHRGQGVYEEIGGGGTWIAFPI